MLFTKTPPKHVVHAYCRVSRDSSTLEQQRDAIKSAYPDGTQFQFYEEIHSAWTGERDTFDFLKKGIERGVVKEITCWSISRLGRNSRQLNQLLELMRKMSVKINIISQPFDWNSPFATSIWSIMSEIAQMESDLKSENTKRKLDWMKENGWVSHSPPPTAVSKKIKMKAPEVYRMLDDGKHYRYIAEQLNISPHTIGRLVKLRGKEILTRTEFAKKYPDWHKMRRSELYTMLGLEVPKKVLEKEAEYDKKFGTFTK